MTDPDYICDPAYVAALTDTTRLQTALTNIMRLQKENLALREALALVMAAVDKARLVPKPGCGVGGQTIEANIRGSVYNGVDAWPIECARTIYEEKTT